jgi:esterase/lipase superfamily enzyme
MHNMRFRFVRAALALILFSSQLHASDKQHDKASVLSSAPALECRSDVTATGTVLSVYKSFAQLNARLEWRAKVISSEGLGKEWSDWNSVKINSAGYSCEELNGKWRCTFSGSPCRKKEVTDREKGTRTCRPPEVGGATGGLTRADAERSAILAWERQVWWFEPDTHFGKQDLSDLRDHIECLKSRNRCVEMWSTAQHKEMTCEKSPHWKCVASANPCPQQIIGISGGFEDPNSFFTKVRVFYATDRNPTGNKEPKKYFGSERAKRIQYGSCVVSIPRGHTPGNLESPKWWKLEFSEAPSKHVTLLKVAPLREKDFFKLVSDRMLAGNRRRAFIFIHGYNVSFEDAARRSAQMSFDLAFDGVPVFYSWPSRGDLTEYPADENTVMWTSTNLKLFLRDFAKRTAAEDIYLIAHSMGNRALSDAISTLLQEHPGLRKRFKEIILAAPDIDAGIFERDIAPKMIAASKNVTLYTSSDDRALKASEKFHGGPARAGDGGENLVIVRGIETIDATGTDASFLAHSYFSESNSVISDLKGLINSGLHAGNRETLCRRTRADGEIYWTVVKDAFTLHDTVAERPDNQMK